MGCQTSRVSVTPEEIAAKRREVKHQTRWWKKFKRMRSCKIAPDPGGLRTNSLVSILKVVRRQSSLEIEILSSDNNLQEIHGEEKPERNRNETGNGKPVTTNAGSIRSNVHTQFRKQAEDDLILEDIEDFSPAQFWDSPSGSQVSLNTKTDTPEDILSGKREVPFTICRDPTVSVKGGRHLSDFVDEDGNKSHPSTTMSDLGGLVKGRTSQKNCAGTKTAQSDLNVLPEIFKLSKGKKSKAVQSVENAIQKDQPVKRHRPKAGKGVRQPPDLTEVYGVELPGVAMESPKRKREEACLHQWMARQKEKGE